LENGERSDQTVGFRRLIGRFSPQQQAVIQAGEGPLCVLAAPGSGKTTTLAGRIAYLVLERHVPATSVLAITFTTAAAAAMRQRLAGVLGALAHQVDIATFHALGLRLIRQWSHQLGYGGVPAVYGRDDARAVLREAAEGLGLVVAADDRRRPADPWAVPLGRLAAAVERFRLSALPTATDAQDVGGFDPDLLEPLSEAYDRLLQQRRAVDFAAMLAAPARLFASHPPALELVQDAYRWVLVDEFQDTGALQYGLLRQVVARHHNLVVMGDPNQCFPLGTLIESAHGPVPIETLRPGDPIVAGAGRGTTTIARILHVSQRDFEGEMVEITLKSGRVLRMTSDHLCFSRVAPRPDIYCVYLMYRQDLGYRVGIVVGAVYAHDVAKAIPGIRYRATQEHADKAWLLRVCATLEEATFHEQLFSLRYGIPRTVFKAAGRGIVFDQATLQRLFDALDTRSGAARLMGDTGLHPTYPHHRPQSHVDGCKNCRLQVHISLFSGEPATKRHPWPAHTVWLNSSDPATELSLQRLGQATRSGRGQTWRVARQFRDATQAMGFADQLAQMAGDVEIGYWAYLTTGRKFAFQPANHLHPTMVVPVLQDSAVMEGEIVSVGHTHYSGPVFDLSIPMLHNYVAQGVVVHNCIYRWTGAAPQNLTRFTDHYPEAKTVVLDQNFRSTGHLVALGNAVAAPLGTRPDCWTANADGLPARLHAAADEAAEAGFVAAEISRLLQSGQIAHAGQVAVLVRTNAQTEALALALRAARIDYHVRADSALLERPEVRDVVAYLRLAHSPADGPALARIVDTPPRRLRSIEQALRRVPVPAAELPAWAQRRGGPPARRRVEELLALVNELHQQTQGRAPAEALTLVLGRTGYQTWTATGAGGEARLATSGAPDLGTWLADLHLGEAAGCMPDQAGAVMVSSIHRSKGLEWPVVFVVGVEDGLLPLGARPGRRQPVTRRSGAWPTWPYPDPRCCCT
jgi:DNA helicase-2/ATP-dependent DNA helicase PcrA